MEFINRFPKYITKVLFVLVIIILTIKVIVPRTSVYFRAWFYYPRIGNYLNHYDVVLVSGESFYLKVKNINKRLTYTSTDYKVAYANYSGRVTAYQPGTAFINVKVKDKTLICRVKVIKLNYESLTLEKGKTKQLNVIGNWFFESYTSSNSNIASVTKKGKVTAISSGTTIITAKAKGKKLTCKVTVP